MAGKPALSDEAALKGVDVPVDAELVVEAGALLVARVVEAAAADEVELVTGGMLPETTCAAEDETEADAVPVTVIDELMTPPIENWADWA